MLSTPEAVGSALALVTGAGMVFKKLGLLHIGKNGNTRSTPCDAHKELLSTVKVISDTQICQAQVIEQHTKQLEDNRKTTGKIFQTLDGLRVDVGILLDRSKQRRNDDR